MLKGNQYVRSTFVVGGGGGMMGIRSQYLTGLDFLLTFRKILMRHSLATRRKSVYMLKGNQYVRSTFVVGGGGGMDRVSAANI